MYVCMFVYSVREDEGHSKMNVCVCVCVSTLRDERTRARTRRTRRLSSAAHFTVTAATALSIGACKRVSRESWRLTGTRNNVRKR